MDKSIAVLAPGGIGAPVGGLLTKAGHDVVLIDQWPAHVDAMKTRGLRITIGSEQEPEGEVVVPVRAYHLYEVCTLRQKFDVVFLTSKSYDTRWLVQLIEPYLKADGVLVSMQNSINEEWIVPIIGNRAIACVLTGDGELLGPGHVWRSRSMDHPYYMLGELGETITPRLEAVRRILGDAGKTSISTDITGARWTKLVRNCQGAIAFLCNERSWKLRDDPRFLAAAMQVTTEALRIGEVLGYHLGPIAGMTAEALMGPPERVARNIMKNTSAHRVSENSVSMVQHDIKAGRPTEVAGYLNGLLVRKGREANVPTPMNEAVVALHERVERRELPWDVSNLELLPRAQV